MSTMVWQILTKIILEFKLYQGQVNWLKLFYRIEDSRNNPN